MSSPEGSSMPGDSARGRDESAPLSFDVWAPLAARLISRTVLERMEILADADIEPAKWNGSDSYWSAALAHAIVAGGSAEVDRYARMCAEEMSRRRAAGQDEARAPGAASTVAGSTEQASPDSLGGFASVDETAWAMAAPIADPLPFAPEAEGDRPASVLKPTDIRLDLAGQTGEAPVVADPPQALPFDPARTTVPAAPQPRRPVIASPAAAEPPLSVGAEPMSPQEDDPLRQYASLCAQLAARPSEALAIRASFGITGEQRLVDLHARWLQRFRAEPALHQRFTSLQRQFLAALRGSAAPG